MDNIKQFDGYDPLKDATWITPLDAAEFSSNLVNQLWRSEQISQDEYLVLDFLGATTLVKEGNVTMSFQGLKRLISLHQARLTKAVNRLVEKDMLLKDDAGYKLTEKGKNTFYRLYKEYRKPESVLPSKIYSHVARGEVQGPALTDEQVDAILEGLVGKWFGKFRFTTQTDYENSVELSWISTDGSLATSLIIGPQNDLRLSLSAPRYEESQNELQLLINHLSQSLEGMIDAPVVFNHHSIYENRQKLRNELDDATIAYAG